MIESAQYIEDKNGNRTGIDAVFTGEGRLDVPLDHANRHYAAILKWVAEGNTIQEAD
tara:strand:- start:147 stop:317 length:171 start_codon:yes stop_codon:yes gene_type:complete